MTGRWGDRRGAPKPPPELWDSMLAAGAADDPIALGVAHARYEAWLVDQGYAPAAAYGSQRPDRAVR